MTDKADEPSGANPEPTELSPPEAKTAAPEAEESTQKTLAEEPPPQEILAEAPPPPPAKSWFVRAEPETEEAERPPPLSPFSALRAERERELKTLASP